MDAYDFLGMAWLVRYLYLRCTILALRVMLGMGLPDKPQDLSAEVVPGTLPGS